MTEEIMNDSTTAGAGVTQEPAQAQESAEAKSEPTLREKMFGDKISKAEPEAEKEEPGEPPRQGFTKKSAKETVQKYAREKNEWKAKAEAGAAEVERLSEELHRLQEMSQEGKTAKDVHREVLYEEQMQEHHRQARAELSDYASKLPDGGEMFKMNYDYYMPALLQHDGWTVRQISKFPEKVQMFDRLFASMTAGVFSPQDWISAPQPVKMQKIAELRRLISQQAPPADGARKDIPDSVVPDRNPRHQPGKPAGKGATFYKVWSKGRTR
jgi:hypothetical protein